MIIDPEVRARLGLDTAPGIDKKKKKTDSTNEVLIGRVDHGNMVTYFNILRRCKLCSKTVYAAFADVCEDHKVKPVYAAATVGRNDPCPCGSGKKHKRCCRT